MSDNEKMNPFFTENEEVEKAEKDAPAFEEADAQPSYDASFEAPFQPIKEIPEEAEPAEEPFQPEEAEASAYEAEEYEPVEAQQGDFFSQYAEPAEEAPSEAATQNEEKAGKSDAFNPYAPKNQFSSADNGQFNGGVSPSYGQPVNSQAPNQQTNFGQGNGYGSYNGNFNRTPNPNPNYYNPNYNSNGYYNPPEKNGGKGKKVAMGVVAVCVIVAVIALVSSFFGSGNKPQTSTTASSPAAFPTETTVPTTIPPVSSSEAQTQQQSQTVQTTTSASTQPVTQQVNSIWVAEKVRPSVVGVLAYQQGELAGEGSGVLMSENDEKTCTYVITCAHVIKDQNCDFSILLLDGTSYEATVVAIDERTDIGVLKVEKTGLPLAEFGDSTSLKVGEPIYAIGNPGGSEYFGSITNGIVASIDRSISATYTMTCIQHNAAINPGNSGGALVNTAGQVIGINSSKIAKTDYEGMGFAVPSAIFGAVANSLIKHGYVPNRPELGIKYASVSDYQLYSIIVSIKGLPKGSIIIAEIPEGSALSGTEAQVGDLITAVNGKRMDSSDVLLDLIDTGAVGDTLTLTLCRINERNYETSTFDVTVTLVENKGSFTTTTQAQTLPEQDDFSDFEDFFGGFFGW